MKIKSIKAKNFLSIGEDPVFIDFEKYGNIVLIKGKNLDIKDNHPTSNGAGKCFAKGTKVIAYDGSVKNVEDVKSGEILMGNDSKPRHVLNTCHGFEKMYDITLSNGDKIVVNQSHVLALQVPNGDEFTQVNMTVGEFLSKSKDFKKHARFFKVGVEFEEKDTPIDPYIIGVMTAAGAVYNNDYGNESLSFNCVYESDNHWGILKNALTRRRISHSIEYTEDTPERLNVRIIGQYRDEFLDFLQDDHAIPLLYRANSRSNRLKLLAGIIDFHGVAYHDFYKIKFAKWMLSYKNDSFLEDLLYLIRSLGFKTKYKICDKYVKITIKGLVKEIPIMQCCVVDEKPCSMLYKFKINCIGVDEYYGFGVDGNNLFLLSDFTVVHNSTITEAITYAFYGKTIRKIGHRELINKKNKKNLEVEVNFSIGEDQYQIVRKRHPDSLRFIKNEEDITLGGLPATQQQIEESIKIGYNAFINITCFGQHNTYDFLSADTNTKRVIVENLLYLDKYNSYCKTAKDVYKKLEGQLSVHTNDYDRVNIQKKNCNNKLIEISRQEESWNHAKLSEINRLKTIIQEKKDQLASTDEGSRLLEYQKAQSGVLQASNDIQIMQEKKEQLVKYIETIQDKLSLCKDRKSLIHSAIINVNSQINNHKNDIESFTDHINSLTNLEEGTRCKVCFGVVDPSNYNSAIKHSQKKIIDIEKAIESLSEEASTKKSQLSDLDNIANKIKSSYEDAKSKSKTIDSKIHELKMTLNRLMSIEKPDSSAINIVAKEQIDNIDDKISQIENELNNANPYTNIIKTLTSEMESYDASQKELIKNIDDLNYIMPYYKFWVDGFGDNGIRSLVIDDIIPTLNNRIEYWLHFLIDNKLKIQFNNNLEETIERNPPDGDPFVYNATCGGERRRIDLAISQAFAYIMMVCCGQCPSIVFLDEVGTFVDEEGINGVYRLICELARDRQVVIITHDQTLLNHLDNCDVITVIKENGFSSLE